LKIFTSGIAFLKFANHDLNHQHEVNTDDDIIDSHGREVSTPANETGGDA
jgi:hypothetical protein